MSAANYTQLDDLEMHDLLRLLYPEHIRGDDDEYYELSQDVCRYATVNLGDGFEPNLADFLGRLVMFTAPMKAGLSGKMSHCIGKVTVNLNAVEMVAAVRRDANLSEFES